VVVCWFCGGCFAWWSLYALPVIRWATTKVCTKVGAERQYAELVTHCAQNNISKSQPHPQHSRPFQNPAVFKICRNRLTTIFQVWLCGVPVVAAGFSIRTGSITRRSRAANYASASAQPCSSCRWVRSFHGC
jgi:hypothetical protein